MGFFCFSPRLTHSAIDDSAAIQAAGLSWVVEFGRLTCPRKQKDRVLVAPGL
jgi:hypothetical protein